MLFNSAIWVIAAVANAGRDRPGYGIGRSLSGRWRGAAMLVLFNLLSWQVAVEAVGRGVLTSISF